MEEETYIKESYLNLKDENVSFSYKNGINEEDVNMLDEDILTLNVANVYIE